MIERHETAAERADRSSRDASLRPSRALPVSAPARLDGHEIAGAAWRRMMRMYGELEAEVVTRLDMDLLIDYCLLLEQVAEVDRMRKAAYRVWLELTEGHDRVAGELEKAKQDEDADREEALTDELMRAAARVVGAFDAVVKLDSRADRKRDLLYKLRQGLYLTPRARAGTAPKTKEPEEPLDPMEQLLGQVTEFVNTGDGG